MTQHIGAGPALFSVTVYLDGQISVVGQHDPQGVAAALRVIADALESGATTLQEVDRIHHFRH